MLSVHCYREYTKWVCLCHTYLPPVGEGFCPRYKTLSFESGTSGSIVVGSGVPPLLSSTASAATVVAAVVGFVPVDLLGI